MRGSNPQNHFEDDIESLLKVVSEFRRGNYAARVELRPSSGPCSQLASELNSLGLALQNREPPTALRVSNEAISGVTTIADAITETVPTLFTNEQFVDILRVSPLGITITRLSDGRIVDANVAYTTICGFSYDELINHTTTELGLWFDPQERQVILDRLFKWGKLSNVEIRLRRKTGEVITVLGTLSKYRHDENTYLVSMISDITERHAATQALEASQRTLQAALASMSDAVFISDNEGRFVEFNEAFATFHKFPSKEKCATTLAEYPDFLEVCTPDGKPAPLEKWAVPRALRGENVTNAEYLLRRRDTGESWVGSYNFGPIRDASGAIVGSVVVGRDVTQLKRTEEALRSSEARYRLLSENGSDVIWLFDIAANRFTYVSPSVEKLRGYSVAEVLQQSMAEALTPESLQRVTSGLVRRVQAFEAGDESQHIGTHEVDQLRKDGSTVSTEVVTTLITDTQGNVTHIQGVSRDVTARKAAEKALRDSEERFHSLVDAAPDAIFIQTGGCFSYVNPATIRLLGATCAEDLLGQNVVSRIHPDSQNIARTRIRLVNLGEPQPPMDHVFLTLTGEPRNINVSAVPFRFEGQHGALVFARDVTARKHAEAAREQAQAQLLHAQKMESIGRLAGGVAHDFNNLLAVVLSYSGFILEELPKSNPIREDLVEIQRSGERARVLTRQLLAFSRQQVLDPTTLNVNEVTEGIVRMLEHTIGEDITLILALAQDIDPVVMDRGQLEQILMNLATNARDAMPEGGQLKIETVNLPLGEDDLGKWPSLSPGEYVQLSVTDNGEGIPDEVRSRIFDPFFTTKPVGKGTGLGLSTVYGIVQQSGGAIAVENAANRGTCMRILLPKGKQPSRQPSPSLPARFKAKGTQTVLVVEDSGPMQKMVTRILSAAGYNVLSTSNPSDALHFCEQHEGQIHLLLTDVVMPEMNGRQLAERVTELRPEAKVLFMSGYANDTIARHGILEPGTNFIAKPFDSADLRNKVFEILAQS